MQVTDDTRRTVATGLREATAAPWPICSSLERMVRHGLRIPYSACGKEVDRTVVMLLADLIDPDSGTGEPASSRVLQCDRDALLALADEIEMDGAGALDDEDWCKPLLEEYARRIREACGERKED